MVCLQAGALHNVAFARTVHLAGLGGNRNHSYTWNEYVCMEQDVMLKLKWVKTCFKDFISNPQKNVYNYKQKFNYLLRTVIWPKYGNFYTKVFMKSAFVIKNLSVKNFSYQYI